MWSSRRLSDRLLSAGRCYFARSGCDPALLDALRSMSAGARPPPELESLLSLLPSWPEDQGALTGLALGRVRRLALASPGSAFALAALTPAGFLEEALGRSAAAGGGLHVYLLPLPPSS